jgi:error-prone DNA polymerase
MPSYRDPFVHLHVASGYSLRFGASHPRVLVERAVEHGMDALALTDRDGVYGAVRFAKACMAAGVTPVLGVDLPVVPAAAPAAIRAPVGPSAPGRRTPARGGSAVDPRHPRIAVLARGGEGWAALCHLVTDAHLGGERGRPVTTVDLVARHAATGGLVVLLGPDSEVGRAVAAHRLDIAEALLARWRQALPAGGLLVEIVSHRAPGAGPFSSAHAARMLGLAQAERLPAVLTNAVRYADRLDAPVADVLDAARRLVPLDTRHRDRLNAEGYLKSGEEMLLVAEETARMAGLTEPAAMRLLTTARRIADECRIDPVRDLGIGRFHLPELEVLDGSGRPAGAVLRDRCEAGLNRRGMATDATARGRLEQELDVIARNGFPSFFLAVADVVRLIYGMGVRCSVRGSGAGSLVTYLLGISAIDPLRHGLLMERFLSPQPTTLPDIDIDVESARRTEIYERILDRYGGERCACVSMRDTYRARHAIRDVGAALGLPREEVDTLAKAFPHIRARDVGLALRELPELRTSGITEQRFGVLFRLVRRLDGLPRHSALHPCGVLLSDRSLLDRTPVEASWQGFPMSQLDKDDVTDLGLLKLDVLGVRMQSAMAHAVAEVARVEAAQVNLDAVPLDDQATFELVRSTRTLGCFQIESPGQRELLGRFGPESFHDLIVDISLFRPGPVKSDMVTPFLAARKGWGRAEHIHAELDHALSETHGVVVFHEQVLKVISVFTGCTLFEADEARRHLGTAEGKAELRPQFFGLAAARGYDPETVGRVWAVLEAFASFGFCKAHAAAFALPAYQSAWLKAHHPAAFLAGVLTHDPGMYPKRLILDDARQLGIAVLPLDVNRSDGRYRVERCDTAASGYGIRLSLADVKGISDAEVARIAAGRPYSSLGDFWQRAAVSRPVAERLVMTGALDGLCAAPSVPAAGPGARRGPPTRRDLLLQVAELHRWGSPAPAAGPRRSTAAPPARTPHQDIRALAARQSQAAPPATDPSDMPVQLTLELGTRPDEVVPSGLPDMTDADRVRAELEVLGLDVSRHLVEFYTPLLEALGVVRARDLVDQRSGAVLTVAGVKVATQTPPVRSGRRVIFTTLDDATGPVDATFFDDAHGDPVPLVAAGRPRPAAPHRSPRRLCAGHRVLGAAHPVRGLADRRHLRRVRAHGTLSIGAAAGRAAGARPPQRVPPVAVRRRPPAGRRAQVGTAQALAHEPRECGRMTVSFNRTSTPAEHLAQPRPGPRPGPRRTVVADRLRARSSVRTAVVWDLLRHALAERVSVAGRSTLDILDTGGGTGNFAVPLAELGHRVTVVDPSPDALAALERRAAEAGVTDRVRGVLGDAAGLLDVVPSECGDVVLCHGVLEMVDDPVDALANVVRALRPAGTVSVLAANRNAVVLSRAIAGHFAEARHALEDAAGRWGGTDPMPRRFAVDELAALLVSVGLHVGAVHGVRVFSDLVPGALVDVEPGALDALLALEAAAAEHPAFQTVATQLHVLATRG